MSTPAAERNWESLPSEISLSILKQLPDLTALHNYLEASPAAARVFDAYGAEIMETHLASGTIHQYTCALIRMSAYMRAGVTIPGVTNMTDFQNMCGFETTDHIYKPPIWTRAPLRLVQQRKDQPQPGDATTVRASVLRSVLASHQCLERLMMGCLTTYLARFRALQPMHLADRDYVWESKSRGPNRTDFVGVWELQPAAVPVVKCDEGPPTWCEEQRVLRGSWRLQLHEDIKAAASAGALNWPDSDIRDIQRLDATYLLDVEHGNWIDKVSGRPDWIRQLIHLEDEIVFTVLDYIEGIEGVEDIAAATSSETLPTRRDWPTPAPSRQHTLEIENYTSAAAFMFEGVHSDPHSVSYDGRVTPLERVPWDYYRRRGFAIWCEARMHGYGLVLGQWFAPDTAPAGVENAEFGRNSILLAWRSVLAKDELALVNRINEEAHAGLIGETGIYLERNVTEDVYRMPNVKK